MCRPAVTPPVDPVFDLGWQSDSDKEGALFGSSVAAAGDVNGDVRPDVIVGAPGAGEPASFDEQDDGGAYGHA
jgi:hypothetical protein